MAGIDPQRKALIDVLNQKEQERLAKQPPPSPLSQALASVAQPFQSYFDRQGKLAREGWDQANMGAEQLRAGDLPMGAANALLGPVNWLTSPINALLPEEQATRDFGRSLGGNVGETLAASGLGLAAIAMPGPDVGKGAKFADEAAEGITAYHGSPYTFDKFSMDKIGTGEGAQAYGHGLYFAENEKVAKGYREVLSPGHKVIVGGDEVNWRHAEQPWASAFQKLSDHGSFDEARRFARIERDNVASWGRDTARHDQTLKSLDDLEAQGVKVGDKAGSMYQVRLNVKPDELLDWDKPLSEQPESVRGILKGQPEVQRKIDAMRRIVGDKAENMSGQSAYAALTGWKQGADLSPTGEAAVATSQKLKAAGIKGIRYKDAGSRGSDGGTYNYVIFDDSLVSILKRYAIPFTLGAGGAAIVSGANMPPELAAQMEPQA